MYKSKEERLVYKRSPKVTLWELPCDGAFCFGSRLTLFDEGWPLLVVVIAALEAIRRVRVELP